MNAIKQILPRAAVVFAIFTLVCGVFYTGAVTGLAQLLFPAKANASVIQVDGKAYGCGLLGQQYAKDGHMWGRIMNLDLSTFKDKNGKRLMYAAPSNLSPASKEYGRLVRERVERLRAANPEMGDQPVPVDLVTCSGSGLDPDISLQAAQYQVDRIAKARQMGQADVEAIIKKCTRGKFLGVFGEKTVNVLKVNLMLDGILK